MIIQELTTGNYLAKKKKLAMILTRILLPFDNEVL